MGNCCKKKLLTERIETVSKTSNENTSKSGGEGKGNKEKNNESNENPKKYDLLLLKDNIASSEKQLNRPKKKSNKNEVEIKLEEKDKKKFKEYKDIMVNYIDFRKKLEKIGKEEKIYVVEYTNIEELISLYNEIIKEMDSENNNEIEIDIDDIINEKVKDFIINKKEIKTKFKVMDLKMCKENIKKGENGIDLLSDELCEKLKLGNMKKGEFNYINEDNGEFRYLVYGNNQAIKIKFNNNKFSLVEIFDENINNKKEENIFNSNNTNAYGKVITIKNKKRDKIETKNDNNNNVKNEDDISLDINSKNEDDNKKPENSGSIKKEEEILDVNLDKEKKDENKNDENEGNNRDLLKTEESKGSKEKKIIDLILGSKESKEEGNDLIVFKILDLFKSQNIYIKNKEISHLCSKNLIIKIKQEVKNSEINEIQIKIEQFKQQNINLIEDKYNPNDMNKPNLFLEKKEVINYNKEKIELIKDFIFLNSELYDLLLKLYNLEGKENLDNIFKKVELLKVDEEFIIMNIYGENYIYICESEEKDEIKFFNIFFVLVYNSKEIYLKEYKSFEKNNFDIDLYLREKKLDRNNYTKKILDEENNEIGYFINSKQPQEIKEDKKEELIQEDKKEEIKEEEKKEEKKEELIEGEKLEEEKKEEEKAEEKIEEKKEEEKKEELIQEEKVEEKVEEKKEEEKIEEKKEEIKEEIKEEKKEEIQNKPIGISNINRNSYLNSFLQCLYHIPQFTNFFISDNNFSNFTEDFFTNTEYLTINDIEINNNSLTFKYLEIIYHLYHKKGNNTHNDYYSPNKILEYIQNQEPKTFLKNEENSPKKLYNYFMKKLKEELKEKEKEQNLEEKNVSDIFNSRIQNEDNLYQEYLSDFKFKNNSIIDQLFTGIKLISIKCEKCDESGQIFEDFNFMHFSLDKAEKNMENKFKKIDLNECFKYYFNNQKVEQICKKCGNNSIYTSKKINLSPKILTIFLENMKEKGNLFKLDIEININEYLKEKNEGYKLIGMITYLKIKGSNESYQAYCYSFEYNKWFCFVDEYVYEVDDIINNIQNTNRLPYILFYNENTA